MLVFRPTHAHLADFAGVGHVGAAVRLLIDALDVDHADLVDAFGNEIHFGPNQIRDFERLGASQKADRDRVAFDEQLVGALLDRLQAFGRQVGQQEVHARAVLYSSPVTFCAVQLVMHRHPGAARCDGS